MPRFAWPALAPPRRWHPPGPVWRRRGQACVVLLAVALLHAWVVGPEQLPLRRVTDQGHAPAMQVVTLAQPAPTPPAPAQPPPAVSPALEAEPQAPEPTAPARTTIESPQVDTPPSPQAAPTGGVEQVAGTVITPADISQPVAAPTPMLVDDAASAAAADQGQRPPVYATSPPNVSFRLVYRVESGDSRGHGQFRVDLQDDGRYRAELQAEDGRRVVMDWVSRGRFDPAGVAPERMVERQQGRDARAVNFQRDQGVVSFSGSSAARALMNGAQDRASLLLQLLSIARAQPGGLRAGQTLRLQVASTRGQAAEWRFDVIGDEVIEPAGQRLAAVRLVREPAQPYDQRVEVWLASAAGHLPVGLRLTTVPGREPVSLWLDGPLPTDAASTPPP